MPPEVKEEIVQERHAGLLFVTLATNISALQILQIL